jgi:hypothetical protein
MSQPSTNPASASTFLSLIGLATLISCGILLLVSLTVLLPPWVKVKCQRRQSLYWSEHVKDYEQTFVGYDFLLAGPKWETLEAAHSKTPGQYFDVMEYRIFWPGLFIEWTVIAFSAFYLFFVLSRRLHIHPEPPKGNAEASPPTDRPRD